MDSSKKEMLKKKAADIRIDIMEMLCESREFDSIAEKKIPQIP